MEAAAGLLGVRQRSVAEMNKRLVRLGYPQPLVEHVVTRLIEMNYLDDEDFARSWVESRDRARPRGELGLRRELTMKGVPREIVDLIMAERSQSAAGEDPDSAAAVALLDRKKAALAREPDVNRRRQKAYALLARNGFGPETCRQAVNAEFLRS